MTPILHGIVRGRSIDIEEDLGAMEGQAVEVKVTVTKPALAGNGLQRCAGALAQDWSPQDDQILEEIHQERKTASRREIPE